MRTQLEILRSRPISGGGQQQSSKSMKIVRQAVKLTVVKLIGILFYDFDHEISHRASRSH